MDEGRCFGPRYWIMKGMILKAWPIRHLLGHQIESFDLWPDCIWESDNESGFIHRNRQRSIKIPCHLPPQQPVKEQKRGPGGSSIGAMYDSYSSGPSTSEEEEAANELLMGMVRYANTNESKVTRTTATARVQTGGSVEVSDAIRSRRRYCQNLGRQARQTAWTGFNPPKSPSYARPHGQLVRWGKGKEGWSLNYLKV